MAPLGRLFNFTPHTAAAADQVDAEFDQLIKLQDPAQSGGGIGTEHMKAAAGITPDQLAAGVWSQYKTIREIHVQAASPLSGNNILIPGNILGAAVSVAPTALSGSSGTAVALFRIVASDFAAGARTTKFRLQATAITNDVGPARTFIVRLAAVTASTSASGNAPAIALGAAVAGSDANLGVQSATSSATIASGDFTLPTGDYCVVLNSSGDAVAGSQTTFIVRLDVRQV